MAALVGLVSGTIVLTGSAPATPLVVSRYDFGYTLQLKVTTDGATGEDISTASSYSIILVPPRGSDVTKTAAFVNTGSDGLIDTTIADGDISKEGAWRVYAKVVMPSGENLRGAIALTVLDAPA